MPIPLNKKQTRKLVDLTFHDTPPTGDLPGGVIGPPIYENAHVRLDELLEMVHRCDAMSHETPAAIDTLSLLHMVGLGDITPEVSVSNMVVSNLDDYGRMQIDYDLYTTLGASTVEVNIYLGKTEVVDEQYLLVTVVDDETLLRTDQASATGDVGETTDIGIERSILFDMSFVMNRNPAYDEILLAVRVNGVDRLLGYLQYPITSENVGAQATLTF